MPKMVGGHALHLLGEALSVRSNTMPRLNTVEESRICAKALAHATTACRLFWSTKTTVQGSVIHAFCSQLLAIALNCRRMLFHAGCLGKATKMPGWIPL